MLHKVVIGAAEVVVAEKACVSAQRRGMHAGEDEMARTIDNGTLALGVRAPEDKDKVVAPYIQFTNNSIGEFLPALPLVRGGSMGTNSKSGIEQQHTLIGPAREVAVSGRRGSEVVLYLLEDINKRRRHGGRRTDREAHAVGLPWLMVGILPDDNDFHLVKGTMVEGIENESCWGIAGATSILLANKRRQPFELRFIKLGL